MLLRPMIARTLLTFAAGASLLHAGCGSSGPRDMNYGTDVALGWVPPDAGAGSAVEVARDTSVVSAEVTAIADGGGAVDSTSNQGQ